MLDENIYKVTEITQLSAEKLDFWVARALNLDVFYPKQSNKLHYDPGHNLPPRQWAPHRFWSQGGPIIEQEKIDLNWEWEESTEWTASTDPDVNVQGLSMLEAGLRAFVIKKLDMVFLETAFTQDPNDLLNQLIS